MDTTEDPGKINRRQLLGLGAGGAASVGLASIAGLASAAPVGAALNLGPNPDPVTSAGGGLTTSAVSASIAGIQYQSVSLHSFFDTGGGRGLSGGTYPLSGGFLIAGLDLPTRAIVADLSIWAKNSSSATFWAGLASYAMDENDFQLHSFTNFPPGTAAGTEFRVTPVLTVSAERQYHLQAFGILSDGTQTIRGARVGYYTGTTLVNSVRVLNNVTVANGANVVVDCSGSVPAGARAALVTILAFQTLADGYYSCFADGAANPGTLKAFWSAGAQSATAALVPLSGSQRFRLALTSTGGSCGAAVDLGGYLL